jgi:hypothetical protein
MNISKFPIFVSHVILYCIIKGKYFSALCIFHTGRICNAVKLLYSDLTKVPKGMPSGRPHVAQWASQSSAAGCIHLIKPSSEYEKSAYMLVHCVAGTLLVPSKNGSCMLPPRVLGCWVLLFQEIEIKGNKVNGQFGWKQS